MTAALSLTLSYFTAACAGSVLVALMLDAGLRRAATRWPALGAHRSIWLAAQCAVVLMFALACAPLPRNTMAPSLALPAAPVPQARSHPEQSHPVVFEHVVTATPARPAPMSAHEAPADVGRLALVWLPAAWFAIYLTGLVWHVASSLRTQRRWRHWLLRESRVVSADALHTWPAVGPKQRASIARMRLTVRTTDLPVSPMLFGVRRACLLLPAHVSALAVNQQRLIVAHELTHRQRADPLWLMLSAALGVMFWFSRPFQRLDAGLREAVELGCDDAVLAGRNAGERRSYAAALVAQLRLQLQWQGHACAAPAFGNCGVTARVQRMQSARPPRMSRRTRVLASACMLAFAAVSATLQPAFSAARASAPVVALSPIPAPAAWVYPLDQVRVTALYGVRSPNVPTGHHGADFAAPRGTPVHAVAPGTVAQVAFDPAWGHFVRVDHGGGMSSLLIHLEHAAVTKGQRIAAGALLGASGSSGKATGPHLHLEYWRDGRRLDPEIMLADLSARASAKALARRRSQGFPLPTDQ